MAAGAAPPASLRRRRAAGCRREGCSAGRGHRGGGALASRGDWSRAGRRSGLRRRSARNVAGLGARLRVALSRSARTGLSRLRLSAGGRAGGGRVLLLDRFGDLVVDAAGELVRRRRRQLDPIRGRRRLCHAACTRNGRAGAGAAVGLGRDRRHAWRSCRAATSPTAAVRARRAGEYRRRRRSSSGGAERGDLHARPAAAGGAHRASRWAGPSIGGLVVGVLVGRLTASPSSVDDRVAVVRCEARAVQGELQAMPIEYEKELRGASQFTGGRGCRRCAGSGARRQLDGGRLSADAPWLGGGLAGRARGLRWPP